jgi:wyosine [tRNA(Phe)-imidazoG37] synthetase (radical SAM superfamily)
MTRLDTQLHDRGGAGLTYVYPVVSRRARGVSVGINLNPNKACNWRCIYCQVQGLVRGGAPEIDLALLERELGLMLASITHGDFMERVPEGSRRLNDVAFSGDGESTSSRQLDAAVEVVGRVLAQQGLLGECKVVLITNGSLVHRPHVQQGLARLAGMNGEVWFKVDSVTPAGRARLNDPGGGPDRTEPNLRLAASLCPTWIQTCVLAIDGEPPSAAEQAAYLDFVSRQMRDRVPLKGVLLYGLERPSHQPEAPRLSKLPAEWLAEFARRIEAVGLPVQVSP